ncbi:MAG: hypothetical protein H7099_04470 [Gemmatimonadaceae bacterium]|nr:hypothetical protein [Gemmatimonadaceae bacterium]
MTHASVTDVSTRSQFNPLTDLSPSELAIVYADQFLRTSANPYPEDVRVPLCGRFAEAGPLAFYPMVTALGALLQAGVLTVRTEKERLLRFWSVDVVTILRNRDVTVAWPAGSPEQRCVDWLETGNRDETTVEAIMRDVLAEFAFNPPGRATVDVLTRGLVDRGIVVKQSRKIFHVLSVGELHVSDTHRAALDAVAPADVKKVLQCRRFIRPAERAACLEYWNLQVRLQRQDSA